ncbi:hypothetical protein J2S73_000097 [Amorphus orientalis]|uniref:Uncharacterized protein n=1 Tax=Amorphus orientalis TaxID=649198 RepID=A0AAE3VKV9_9HYPH|nr:hypothetical protein [Amorphus orientalis]
MDRSNRSPPPGWGDDKLTAYIENFRANQFATFHHKKTEFGDACNVDNLFLRFLDGAMNPTPFPPVNFLLRAHSSFRASVSSVMGGQVYEAYAILRVCLEQAAYGFYIGSDSARWELWAQRGESKESRAAVRKEFTAGKIIRHLRMMAPNIAGKYERLYERLIDYGAHPNEQGFVLSSSMVRSEDIIQFNSIYLHEDGHPLEFALSTCVQVGIGALQIAQLIYPTRFMLLGIGEELTSLRSRY